MTSFTPYEVPFRGCVRVPGDKSISHRAVLLAAMAEGTTHLSGLLDSADVRSSVEAVRVLGADVQLSVQEDASLAGTIHGFGSTGPRTGLHAIDCGNSGTTMRLISGLLAGYNTAAVLTGDASLSRRPMRRVAEPLELMGAAFELSEEGTLPATIRGTRPLHAIDYTMPHASAQVKSAILLAGLAAQGRTSVRSSQVTRDHTERMLPAFGVSCEVADGEVSVSGPTMLEATEVNVPGDPSSAAFLLVAAALKPESEVTVKGMSLNETRTGFLKVMRRMGVHMRIRKNGDCGLEPFGDVTVFGDELLHATRIPADEIGSLIDEVPVLALLACKASGTTCFEQVGELRVKESDRLSAIIEGLRALGCSAYEKGDDLYVEGGIPTNGAELDSCGDHRLAMCWALAGMCFKVKVEVSDFGCVGISYPRFEDDMRVLAQGQ